MEQDPFWILARETIIDILSRLPIPSIIRCKSVCKSWLDLVECEEFTKSHESRSVPCLALYRSKQSPSSSKPYEIIDIVDELSYKVARIKISALPLPYCNLAFSFSFPNDGLDNILIHSSVNGLLFLCNGDYLYSSATHKLFICNPVTRQYINIPHPIDDDVGRARYTFGFGVSKTSGQYKLMRITTYCSGESQYCEVYTLGTGGLMWRRIDATLPHGYVGTSAGAFLNGNLHWLIRIYAVKMEISYFDLETEHVSCFSLPPLETDQYYRHLIQLSALGDCLCLCNNSDYEKIDIWLMKEYGDDKSWVKEFIINKPLHINHLLHCCRTLFPVKVFKDGDILFGDEDCARLQFLYFNKTKTIQTFDALDSDMFYLNSSCINYTPSFLDLLKTFAMENVCSF